MGVQLLWEGAGSLLRTVNPFDLGLTVCRIKIQQPTSSQELIKSFRENRLWQLPLASVTQPQLLC